MLTIKTVIISGALLLGSVTAKCESLGLVAVTAALEKLRADEGVRIFLGVGDFDSEASAFVLAAEDLVECPKELINEVQGALGNVVIAPTKNLRIDDLPYVVLFDVSNSNWFGLYLYPGHGVWQLVSYVKKGGELVLSEHLFLAQNPLEEKSEIRSAGILLPDLRGSRFYRWIGEVEAAKRKRILTDDEE